MMVGGSTRQRIQNSHNNIWLFISLLKSIRLPLRGIEGGIDRNIMKREPRKQIMYLLIARLEDWMERDPVGGCEMRVRKGEKSCWE